MSVRFRIVLGLALLLHSCAQVEPLSGGERDRVAPKPHMEKMLPQNGSINYSGNQLAIPFDEFFRLNNPSENIIVIPPDFKPKAKIKNKTLILSWDEKMQPNTTYAFYLNGVVQDLTEKNDSLMSFVFSTGDFIDSLSATFSVRDAFNKELLPNQTIGLYKKFSDSILPDYFGKTNENGVASLSYMKPGKYTLIAFSDKNKSLKPEKNESFGSRFAPVNLSESYYDSFPILISPPADPPKISTFQLKPPGVFIVGSNRTLKNSTLTINGKTLSEESFIYYSNDSLLAPFTYSDTSVYELIVSSSNWSDTSSIRMTQGEKNVDFSLGLMKNTPFYHNEPIVLIANQNIESVDFPNVTLINSADSSIIPFRRIKNRGATIEFDFDRKPTIKSAILKIPAFSILADHSRNEDTLVFKIDCLTEKEVGVLNTSFEGFETAIVVDLMSKGKLEKRVQLEKGTERYTFKNLIPGLYSFRIVIDENGNGKWDGGNYAEKKGAEDVRIYLESKKVRGNWETDILLKKEGDGK